MTACAPPRRSAPWQPGAAACALLLLAAVFGANVFARELRLIFQAWPGIDKIVHFVGYAVVFVTLHAATRSRSGRPSPTLLAAIGGAALSIADETVQQMVPGRNVELADIAADVAGLTAGWLLTARPSRHIALPAGAAVAISLGVIVWTSHVGARDLAAALRAERAHDFSAALQHYRRALAAGHASPELYNSLAWVEIESGEGSPADAVHHASRALGARPANPDFLDTYGWALHFAGRHAEALSPLLEAYRLKPQMFCIHYHLGAVYQALGRRDEAEAHLKRQLALPHTREAAMAAQALGALHRQGNGAVPPPEEMTSR